MVWCSAAVDRRRPKPPRMPLERLLLGLTLGIPELDNGSPTLGMLESAELLILGEVDPDAAPPPPRIVFTSCDIDTGTFAANKRELDEELASFGVVALLRPPEGLGIFDPEGTLALEVVDMYMGGRMVGVALALGGSIAESV